MHVLAKARGRSVIRTFFLFNLNVCMYGKNLILPHGSLRIRFASLLQVVGVSVIRIIGYSSSTEVKTNATKYSECRNRTISILP